MDWKTRIPAFLLWIFLLLSSIENGNAEQRVVCYYTNWSVYRPGTAKFSPQNINPYLCTHLIYAFGGFTKDNTLKPFDKYQDIEKGGYAKFTGLKTYNKDLKTMLAIGGWNEGSSRFSPMVADPDRRKDFVKNSIKFLRQNHFDGLDLDWEYPAFRDGGKPRDKNNYADLVQELREEFERESSKTGRPRLLLSMAVPAGIEYIDKGYDIPRLNDYLDFINLLSYDYHSAYEPAANHHSPLYPLEEDNEYNYDTELTIDYTIEHLLKSGASPEKIVLGIPTYGRSYTLFNEDATDIGAPADGPGEEGDATREKGYLAYYEICESLAKSDEWEVVQPNPKAMGPYAFRANQWVGYDDENIVRAKARYVNDKKLGGIMFWSIDNDDFRGKCHGRPYPLIEAAKEALLIDGEKSTSGARTRLSESNRKKTRTQGGRKNQGSSTGRKFKTGRRTSTTESPTTNRRLGSSRTNGRFKARVKSRDDENEENDEEVANSVKFVERTRSGSRVKDTRSNSRPSGGGRRKQQKPREDEEKTEDDVTEGRRVNKLTTPEPPTTPDPGTDFKCEDEGFFSHPRDCKKYFWCLDSGPGGLGIVAHQFTCPSGLVFNKAADSCDYPRNVVCPKTKTSQNVATTTREPITAATSRTTYLHKPTKRTTTPKSESEEEYEYYDEDDDENVEANDSRESDEEIRTTTKTYKTINRSRPTTTSAPITTTTETAKSTSTRSYKASTERATSFEDEEDPRVIKELIDLIKKAGGIEQLEKQLHYQEKNSGSSSDKPEENGRSTPATISRSLYERVLNRQATKIAGGFLGSLSRVQSAVGDKSEQGSSKNSRTGFVNGPGGAQFEGLDEVPEVKSLRRTTKHQYVTIDRQRHSTSESPTEDDEEVDEDDDDDDNKEVASSEDHTVGNSPQDKPSNRRVTPSYVNIRRPRPSAPTENDVEVKDKEEGSEVSEDNEEKQGEANRAISKTVEESSSPKSRYTNAQRFRSTTSRSGSEIVAGRSIVENDSTTARSASTTTTEEAVIEDNSEASVTLPTTVQPESDNLTLKYNSTLEENAFTVNPEPTEASNESTLSLVDNSATEILFTTVPAASISAANNHDSFTREPSIPVVSQPRPFGFSRRGRPTTSSTTTVASVTEQTRSKVDSDTLRLPTLKELVGSTTTLSNDESTSELPQTSTTYRDADTTIDVGALRGDSDYPGYQKNNADYGDESRDGMNISHSDGPSLEPTVDREIFDNDILSSEEIQNRSPSASFVNVLDNNTRQSSDHEARKLRKNLRRVEVPVKILDDSNGEAIAELVLLRVPENKLNSAILKPVFRVKILDREVQEQPVDLERGKKNEDPPDASVENELADKVRSTSGNRRKTDSPKLDKAVEGATGASGKPSGRPKGRQRIVKARPRPFVSKERRDELTNARSNVSRDFRVKEVRKTSETPEPLETSTTIRPTTKRGDLSSFSKVSKATRGFYVTRNIDETSVVSDSASTDFVETTQFLTTRFNDVFHDSTEKIGPAARISDSTVEKMDFTTDKTDLATPEMVFTEESGILMKSTVSSVFDGEHASTELETTVPEDLSTMAEETSDVPDPLIPTDKDGSVGKSEITTFRPWMTEQPPPTDPTMSTEPTTAEHLHDASTVIDDIRRTAGTEKTIRNASELLMTSENSQWASSTPVETRNTVVPLDASKKVEKMESTTEMSKVEDAAATAASGIRRNNARRNSLPPKFESRATTITTKSSIDKNTENVAVQTEMSSTETENYVEESTTRREFSNRGGVRYGSKPSEINDGKHTSTREQFLSSTKPGLTESRDKTAKKARSEGPTLPTSWRTTLRERNDFRKTTKALEIGKKASSSIDGATTEAYVQTEVTVNDDSTLTSNPVEDSLGNVQRPRPFSTSVNDDSGTTEIFGTDASESYASAREKSLADVTLATEVYDKSVKVTDANYLSSYPITNPEVVSMYPAGSETTESSGNYETRITTRLREESPETSTSLSDEETPGSENFETSTTRSLSYPGSFEDPDASMNSPNPDESLTTAPSDSSDETLKRWTGTAPTNELTANYAETTLNSAEGRSAARDFDPYAKTTRSSGTRPDDEKDYDENAEYGSTTVQLDYSTVNSSEEKDFRVYTTITSEQTGGRLTTTEVYDKTDETANFVNKSESEVTLALKVNRSDLGDVYETTASYDETSTSWLYVETSTKIGETTPLPVERGSFNSTTTSTYPTTDFRERSSRKYDRLQTVTNDQTIPEVPSVFEKNGVRKEPNPPSSTARIFTSEIHEDSTGGTDVSAVERKLKSIAESPLHEERDNVDEDASKNVQKQEVELASKRTRGRIRFTNFAGNSNGTSESSRRPVKQVVVRRRLAKDRHQNPTTPEAGSTGSENPTSGEERGAKVDSEYLKNKRINNENGKNEENKIEDARNFRETLRDRSPEEKNASPTRRRIVVYRGRPRHETSATSATTAKPRTTTVQSSSPSGNEIPDGKKRQRRKWRKRIVLKREKVNVEEEDQSIAETNDFERALTSDGNIGEFRDELGNSYVLAPPEIERISMKHEDILGEVNLLKNSGSFLRKPGTLVRNDALNRLRSKSPSTLVSTNQPDPLAPFSRIQTTTGTPYEMKTEDQSVRAQEVAVTLSDPPGTIDSSSTTGRLGLRKHGTRKISTTVAPRTETPSRSRTNPAIIRRRGNNKAARYDDPPIAESHRPIRPRRPPIVDYDYYVDDDVRLVVKPELKDKLYVTQKGGIRCLDQGNFAHPTSCKKFITCARMVNGQVIGTEYTCPDKLSFDPVGGICNWSAGLGCEEKSKSSK